MKYPELEISFDHRDERHYGLQFRFDSHMEAASPDSEIFDVEIDWEKLTRLALLPVEYGKALSEMVFKDPGARDAFRKAREHLPGALRIRISLSPQTPRLHDVVWEAMANPETGARMSTDERTLMSRFVSNWDFRPVHLRRRDELHALVVIPSPVGIAGQQVAGQALAPINVNTEWQRASSNLGKIAKDLLSGEGRASIRGIFETLRSSKTRDYDILYLVCHGALVKGEPLLWLEDEEGNVHRTSGTELVLRLKEMLNPPRLVVLASCQSAGASANSSSPDQGALSSLAPRLAAAGIPAVVAMQDSVSMESSGTFFSTFFAELVKDGQIDRAVTVARSSIRDRDDWWMPVLITRLKPGRLWFEHSRGTGADFQNWEAILGDLTTGRCTPILGPGLLEPLFGKPIDIARRWAERYDFPMAYSDRDSLPQVAQYLSYHRNPAFPRNELRSYIREFLLKNFPDETANLTNARHHDLIAQVGKRKRAMDGNEIHKLLAAMPFSVYITTNRDDLLRDALLEAGKDPQIEVCRWSVFDDEDEDAWPGVFANNSKYRPSVKQPLVFHVFGNMRYPKTLVLTEDDYFSYLIGVNKKQRTTFGSRARETGKDPMPQAVIKALTNRGLLFLGFRVTDWEFRTFFRGIRAFEGKRLRPDHTSVSVQLEPEEQPDFLEPLGARNYIEQYFRADQCELYWGAAQDFVMALHDRWVRDGRVIPEDETITQ